MTYKLTNSELKCKDINNFKSGDVIICGDWHIEVVKGKYSNFGVITKNGYKNVPLRKVPQYLKNFSKSVILYNSQKEKNI